MLKLVLCTVISSEKEHILANLSTKLYVHLSPVLQEATLNRRVLCSVSQSFVSKNKTGHRQGEMETWDLQCTCLLCGKIRKAFVLVSAWALLSNSSLVKV